MRVIVSVTNDIVTDQRVERTCEVLRALGADVTLMGRKLNKSLPVDRPYKVKRWRLLFNKTGLFYAEYNIRLFFYLLFHHADLLFANDLDTLPANVLAKRIKNIPVIYDSHEYFCGVPELENRKMVKSVWKYIEKKCIRHITTMITVNKSIARLYKNEYNVDAHVVRNIACQRFIPEAGEVEQIRNNVGKPFFIYQGVINVNRGIEEVIQAMEFIDDYKFVIAGDGDLFDKIKRHINSLSWKDNIIVLGRLHPRELVKYTNSAIMGISPENDTCTNYHYALPNKLFDYINAGLPVLVSNLVEMVDIVQNYNIGQIIESHQPQRLASQIINMLNNKDLMHSYSTNVVKAKQQLSWSREANILSDILKKHL